MRALRLAVTALVCAGIFAGTNVSRGWGHEPVASGGSTNEIARPARAFVDSVGVNVHLSYHDGPYGHAAQVAALIRDAGIKHVRDGVALGQTDVCGEAKALAPDGVRFTYIVQAALTPADLQAWATCTAPAIEAFEGLNEYDISHPGRDAQWAQTVRATQTALYRTVKSKPALQSLAVVGPSLTSANAYAAVGDLTAAMDAGNTHDYFAGHEPGTSGWGLGGYGSIGWNLKAARSVGGDKPVEATETGYSTNGDKHSVDLVTQGKYVPRMFLEQFNAGIVRTFDYELVDEGGPPFDRMGLVDGRFGAKPAYTALRGLLGILRDDRAPQRPAQLAYRLDGANADVHHTLLEKSDGRIVLALWIEAAGYNSLTHAAIDVPTQRVSLHTATRVSAVTVYEVDDTGRWHPSRPAAAGSVTLTLSDRVTLVELTPRGAA